MKTLLELAELEINELEYVLEHKEDMPEYMLDFEKYTAKDILHVMKSLVKQYKEFIAAYKGPVMVEEVVKRGQSEVA